MVGITANGSLSTELETRKSINNKICISCPATNNDAISRLQDL